MKQILKKQAILFLTFTVLFFSWNKASSQAINPPTFSFTFVCAAASTNNFNATFSFTPGSFNAGNNFILELSDLSGFFTTPVQLQQITTTTSPGNFVNFAFPTNTNGLNYRLRVRSTSPALISGSSAPFEAHYKPFIGNFWLNNKALTLSICGSSSLTLFIDDATPQDPSPKAITGLTYKWFKDGSEIIGQTGTSYVASASGNYQAFIDYGTCSTFNNGQDEKSQVILVNIVATGATFTIASSGGSTICPSNPTTLSVTPGYTYQWFRDGVSISGATAYNYVANQAGSYTVAVNQGGCSSTAAPFVLSTTSFNSSIDVLQEPLVNIIAAGETKTITVTNDATSPVFEWYLYDSVASVYNLISPLVTTNTYSTDIVGRYKVIVKQTSGCVDQKQYLFELKEGINPKEVPNLISPNGDGKNETWIIPQEYVNANTEILIISPQGNVDFQTVNYQNNWPVKEIDFKSVNPVYYYIISKDGSPIKKGSITIIK